MRFFSLRCFSVFTFKSVPNFAGANERGHAAALSGVHARKRHQLEHARDDAVLHRSNVDAEKEKKTYLCTFFSLYLFFFFSNYKARLFGWFQLYQKRRLRINGKKTTHNSRFLLTWFVIVFRFPIEAALDVDVDRGFTRAAAAIELDRRRAAPLDARSVGAGGARRTQKTVDELTKQRLSLSSPYAKAASVADNTVDHGRNHQHNNDDDIGDKRVGHRRQQHQRRRR